MRRFWIANAGKIVFVPNQVAGYRVDHHIVDFDGKFALSSRTWRDFATFGHGTIRIRCDTEKSRARSHGITFGKRPIEFDRVIFGINGRHANRLFFTLGHVFAWIRLKGFDDGRKICHDANIEIRWCRVILALTDQDHLVDPALLNEDSIQRSCVTVD